MKETLTTLLLLVLFLFCLTGCQKTDASAQDSAAVQSFSVDEYLSGVKAQADVLQTALEQEELTQTDMNQKSKELADLWDEALNRLLEEAKKTPTAAEAEALTAEQSAWETEREAAVKAAGKEFEGGSMYSLVVNSEAAQITEARVMELAEKLKSANQ